MPTPRHRIGQARDGGPLRRRRARPGAVGSARARAGLLCHAAVARRLRPALSRSFLPRSVVTRVEIGPLPPRDRSTSASRSVVTRAEIGPVPQVCCVLMVPRCGMRLSPSSSSCVPRRRAGQAEPDRSRTGTGPISMRDVAGVPGGRRSSSMLHMGGWGLCRARLVLVGITEFSSDHRARRSCSHAHLGGLRTWEQDRARY